jgi:glycosyltransferase involved in cell wall biosynthesis
MNAMCMRPTSGVKFKTDRQEFSTQKMRVALLTYDTTVRGGLVHAVNLGEALQRKGVHVEIFALGANDKLWRQSPIPYHVYPKKGAIPQWIDEFVKQLPTDFDVYHAQDCVAALALQKLKKSGAITAPTVRTIHHINDFKSEPLLKMQDAAATACDRAIVVSEYWRGYVAKHYGVEATVIKNGVDERFFTPDEKTKEKMKKDNKLLFVGALHNRKGIEYLLEALSRVRNFDGISLDMVCNSINPNHNCDIHERPSMTIERLKQKIGALALAEKITIFENVSDARLRELYKEARLFVFPTLNEGCGLVLLEAMASGTPVITSKIAPIEEFIVDGYIGLLVEPRNAEALAQAILKALTDGALYRKLSENGKKTAHEFSWERAADQTLALYREALENRK